MFACVCMWGSCCRSCSCCSSAVVAAVLAAVVSTDCSSDIADHVAMKPCETNFASVLTPRHIAKWKHGRLYHCEPSAHIQRILRINLITAQTADEVCRNQMQHPKLKKYVETYETRYAWAQHIRTIRNGRARLTHIKNIILIRNIRKTRNISNHEKHNIIIRNIRNANTTNVTLGFSSIVPPRTFKNTGVWCAYIHICELTFTPLIVTRSPCSSLPHAYSILLKSLPLLLASAILNWPIPL